MRVSGTVCFIGKTENVGKKKPFYKRLFVIDNSIDERYPNPIPFDLTRSNTALADNFSVGDEVTVEFFLEGRKWTDKEGRERYFLTARADKIFGADSVPEAPKESEDAFEDTDDVPF